MVTCQSANQLKTPAKVSWAFKMVSQFGSLGYTIMGKTADLTVVQKTIIDTLHKEDKPQTFIAKEAGCSQSAVSKHVNRKLSGRKKCGRKRCKTNRENRSLMRIVKQNRFKNLGELHKEWTEAGVKASRATTHRRVKEFGYSCRQRRLTWAKEKKNWTVAQWSNVLFSDESKFCILFGNQGPRVWRKGGEAHSPSCLKSSVKFPQSVCIMLRPPLLRVPLPGSNVDRLPLVESHYPTHTHRSCVCPHFLNVSNSHFRNKHPLKTKRGWRDPQAPFYFRSRSFAYVIGFHLPI